MVHGLEMAGSWYFFSTTRTYANLACGCCCAIPRCVSNYLQTIKGVEAVATPSTLFYAENAAILPLWLGMIIWPEKPVTKAIMSSYATVIVAALLYVWLTYEALQVHATDNMAC